MKTGYTGATKVVGKCVNGKWTAVLYKAFRQPDGSITWVFFALFIGLAP